MKGDNMGVRLTLTGEVMSNPHKKSEAFHHHAVARTKAVAARHAGGFDFPTTRFGATADGMVTVYYDPSLGAHGKTLAHEVLGASTKMFADCQRFFAMPGRPVNVVLAALEGRTDGSAGAYHYGCTFHKGGTLYCDVAFGNLPRTIGLIVAELTESFMGAQAKGWDCGGSNGEALSRVLAQALSGGPDGALAEYATGPAWDQSGQPNWIDATEPTDQDAASTGCGVLYLYWMLSKGFTLDQLTQAGCPDGTLASNYQALTGAATAWSDFSAAVKALPDGVSSDNPWGAVAKANVA
jgi:hypothetical protein